MLIPDSFLTDSAWYRELIKSVIPCQDSSENILQEFSEDNLKLYHHFNHIERLDPEFLTPERLEKYLEFLEKYQYPEDDFLLVLLEFGDLNSQFLKEIRKRFEFLDDSEFRFDNPDFLDFLPFNSKEEDPNHLCLNSKEYLKVFRLGLTPQHNLNKLLITYAESGYLKIVKYLLEPSENKPKIADLHADNDCAFRQSAKRGRLEMIKYLKEKGANIHAMSDYALRHSARGGHLEVVKYLLELSPDTAAIFDCIPHDALHLHLPDNVIEYLKK